MQEIQKTRIRSMGLKNPLEEEMATHSNIPAWKILGTEKPGGLWPMGHKESDMTDELSMQEKTYMYTQTGTLLGFRNQLRVFLNKEHETEL